MFQTLIRPSSGACDYLLRCVGWLEACWCHVAGLSVGDVVSECRLNHYYLSSGACDYLVRYCVGCIVLTWGVLVLCSGIVCWWCGIRVQAEPLLSSGSACTRIPHHQQTIPLHNTSTPQDSLHNATNSRKLLKMDVLTSETCWAVDNKASVI